MAEIKKINGNTLCDETARDAADEAKTVADEAKGLAETAGESATEAKTAAETAQKTADKANDRGQNLAYHLKGKAMAAQYDATVGKLKCAAYSPDSTGTGTTYVGYQEIKKTAVIWVGDRAYTIQSSKAYNSIVATCPDEDGLHILTGGFKTATGVDCEFTETVVPYVEQVQADWNENDPESPAYIQNRIGGYKRSEAERLVEYDETTAEYIDVDATGSGTAMRYRKASDTLVRKEDWVGGKTVIVIDAGSGEQETTLNIGTGESNAIAIIGKEYAAGKIWLTVMSEFCCGIIAPQETDLSASADGVSVVASGGTQSGVVPKGVWIMDMPYVMNLMYGNGTTGYHKAVYCAAGAKIPEEYLETITADEAKTTADEAKTTAESALVYQEKEIEQNNISVDTSADSFAKNGFKYYKWKDIVIDDVIECEITSSAGETKRNVIEYPGCISFGGLVMCVYKLGELTADYTFNAPSTGIYVCYDSSNLFKTRDVYIKYAERAGVNVGESALTATDGKLLLDGEPVAPTYTAGDGIAIEDGVITADTASSATEATEFYLKSSTADSAKRFKITVDDTGALTATEVV